MMAGFMEIYYNSTLCYHSIYMYTRTHTTHYKAHTHTVTRKGNQLLHVLRIIRIRYRNVESSIMVRRTKPTTIGLQKDDDTADRRDGAVVVVVGRC